MCINSIAGTGKSCLDQYYGYTPNRRKYRGNFCQEILGKKADIKLSFFGKSECHFGGSEELKLKNGCLQGNCKVESEEDLILDSAATGWIFDSHFG